jgi:hypothetical protein
MIPSFSQNREKKLQLATPILILILPTTWQPPYPKWMAVASKTCLLLDLVTHLCSLSGTKGWRFLLPLQML